MKERLQEYALVGEIVGAVAIVITLVYVGLEISQSNALASTESLRVGTQAWANEYSDSFGSEESTAFMRKAINDYDSLSQDEKGRFFAAILGFVAAFDTLHNQFEVGLLREEVYLSIAGGYYALVTQPGVQQLFQENITYLPAYLVSPEGNDVLIVGEEYFAPYTFLRD